MTVFGSDSAMSAVRRAQFRLRFGAVAGALGLCALALGYAATVHPGYMLVLPIVAALGAVCLTRPFTGVCLLCSSFYFEGYLSPAGQVVTAEKLIGLLVAAGCFGAWSSGRWPYRQTRASVIVLLLLAWLVPTGILASDHTEAALTIGRYVAFVVAFIVVVQAVGGEVDRAERLTRVMVYAAGASAAAGAVFFATGGVFRASGPISDANDFAFLLGSTLPLGLYHARRAERRSTRLACGLASALMVATILATLSRGEFVGLAVGGIWAVGSGRVRLRWLLVVAAVAATVAVVATHTINAHVTESVSRKEVIAQNDVSSRLYYWNVALKEFEGNPLTGVGPGQFQVRFFDYAPPYNFAVGTQTTHNTYLNVLAELGAIGFVLFMAYMLSTCASLSRCLRLPGQERGFGVALTASFLVAAVSASFLTEQYYAPLWVLGALAASVASSRDVGERQEV